MLVYLQLLLLTVSFSSTLGLNCGDGKIRGVNLGGWLVLEEWMTPRLFDDFQNQYGEQIIDEYTLAESVPENFYKERIVRHWDTFFSRQEIQKLSDSGISHVRIPVPYWFWEVSSDEPFPAPNQNENDPNSPMFYLKRMLGWLEELGMAANVDLHTAPGSQNGFDNSGRTGDPHWVEWGQVGRTKEHIRMVAQTMKDWINKGYISSQTIYSFCVLNEPGGWDPAIWDACRYDYYPAAYANIRSVFPEWEIGVNIQQAFRNGWELDGLLTAPDYQNVAVDMHVYQCFGDYWNSIHNDDAGKGVHFDYSCGYAQDVKDRYHWTFSGEWSLGNAGPWDFNDPNYVEFLRLWFLSQIDAFEYTEKGNGWFFWSAKIENDYSYGEWNYLSLLDRGVAPANLCQRETFCIFKENSNGELIETSYNKTMASKAFKLTN